LVGAVQLVSSAVNTLDVVLVRFETTSPVTVIAPLPLEVRLVVAALR
jgi:hypothetical protein